MWIYSLCQTLFDHGGCQSGTLTFFFKQGVAIWKISPCLSRQDFVEICFQLKIPLPPPPPPPPPTRVAGPGLSDYPISGSLLPPSRDIWFQIMQSIVNCHHNFPQNVISSGFTIKLYIFGNYDPNDNIHLYTTSGSIIIIQWMISIQMNLSDHF